MARGEAWSGASCSSSPSPSSSSAEEDGEEAIMEEMSQIPFDVLQKIKQNGSAPRRRMLKADADEDEDAVDDPKGKGKKKKGKHMPQEFSSKRPYNPYRDSKQTKRRVRDPRFDGNADEQDKDHARRNYKFIFDEIIPEEQKRVQASMKRAKGEMPKQNLKRQLKNLQDQVVQYKNDAKAEKRRKELKAMTKSKSGKKTFFLKKSEVKKQMLLHRYNDLKKRGKLDDYLAKRRKRNAAKEHKHIPMSRRME